jgi:hypothetical protein
MARRARRIGRVRSEWAAHEGYNTILKPGSTANLPAIDKVVQVFTFQI